MGFNSTHKLLVFHNLPEGDWEVVEYGPVGQSGEGWDTQTIRLMGFFPEIDAGMTDFGGSAWSPMNTEGEWIGLQPDPGRNFWVTDATISHLGGGICEAILQTKGWSYEKPAKTKVASMAQIIRATNVLITELDLSGTTGPWKQVEVADFSVVYTRTYLATGAIATEEIGLPVADTTGFPDVRASFFTTIPEDEALRRFPDGWILMNREGDTLAGTDANLIIDTIGYSYKLALG